MSAEKIAKALAVTIAIGVVSLFLIVNWLWFRVALPHLVNAHSDGLLITAVATTIILLMVDAFAILSAPHFIEEVKSVLTEEENEEA